MTKDEIVEMMDRCIENTTCRGCPLYNDPYCVLKVIEEAKHVIEEQHKKLMTYSVRGVR